MAPGTSVIALDQATVDIELPADRFQSYLLEERLIDILSLRAQRGQEDAPGRERYSRCLKALARVGQADRKAGDAALRPIGQELEIVPLEWPYGLRPGGRLPVQVIFRGRPLAGLGGDRREPVPLGGAPADAADRRPGTGQLRHRQYPDGC